MSTNIAFIGAGKVSTALGLYFKNKGFGIQGYFTLNYQSGCKAAKLTNSRSYTLLEDLINDSRMIWITTPDDQIQTVVRQIDGLSIHSENSKLILHTSGVHPLSILDPLKKKGYQTSCVHPLFAFNDPIAAQSRLNDVWFGIENTKEENQLLTDFFKTCGNQTLKVDSDKKILYHAAACVLSNYLVTLLDASYKIFEESGIAKDNIGKATAPLLQSVIQNLKDKECIDALTGPIKRGDANTVRMHLESLHAFMPQMEELYKLLGKQTMEMLNNYALEKILK